jgi:CheY-specific phosphatase CheX
LIPKPISDQLIEAVEIILDRVCPIASPGKEIEICAALGFSGPKLNGTLVLGFDRQLALMSHPLGSELSLDSPELVDWGGELVNLAVGQFKSNLERYGVTFNILQPVVCIGAGIKLFERGKHQAFAGWVGSRAKVYSYLVAQVSGEIDFSTETQGNAVARLVVF